MHDYGTPTYTKLAGGRAVRRLVSRDQQTASWTALHSKTLTASAHSLTFRRVAGVAGVTLLRAL